MPDIETIGREILAELQSGWNEGDGDRFAGPFSANADFVDIRGEHHRGKDAIAAGHHGIFASIYKGSRVRYELAQARSLTGDVVLIHSTAELDVPSGPLAGVRHAIQSLVLKREAGDWKVASFHNTVKA